MDIKRYQRIVRLDNETDEEFQARLEKRNNPRPDTDAVVDEKPDMDGMKFHIFKTTDDLWNAPNCPTEDYYASYWEPHDTGNWRSDGNWFVIFETLGDFYQFIAKYTAIKIHNAGCEAYRDVNHGCHSIEIIVDRPPGDGG